MDKFVKLNKKQKLLKKFRQEVKECEAMIDAEYCYRLEQLEDGIINSDGFQMAMESYCKDMQDSMEIYYPELMEKEGVCFIQAW